MRLSHTPQTLVSLLIVVLAQPKPAVAGPYPKDDLHDLGFSFLQDRDCVAYCGVTNQYCCTAGQACYTNAQTVAYCGDAVETGASGAVNTAVYAAGPGWAYYTTTYTETDLVVRTSTFSSYVGQPASTEAWAPPATSAAICVPSSGETSCGAICCSSTQTCAWSGKCQDIPAGGLTSWSYAPTSSFSAPLRPTSGGATATATVSATTTEAFGAPATASGSSIPITATSSKGLSGGAIAGIVIGVIAGIILLLLFCFCCIMKAGFDGLLALFGLGNDRRRRRVERVETVERYERRGSAAASRRESHGGWFGAAGGGRPTRVVEQRKKKSSGMGGMGAVGAGLVGLAVLLGLKRRHDRKEREKRARSDISSSYYTDSLTGTSASSASSDRRTRDTRRH